MFGDTWVVLEHLQPNSSQKAAADETWTDMDATCSSLVEDVGTRAYILELAYDDRILVLVPALLGSHIRQPLREENENSGWRSILVLGGCSAGCPFEKVFATGCSVHR